MSGAPRTSIVSSTAIYSLICALLNACFALSFIGLGIVSTTLSVVDSSELTAEQQQALTTITALGGWLPILGILFTILAVLLLVDAVGLFQFKSWVWMLTIGTHSANVVLSVLSWQANNFSFLSLVFAAISGVMVYLFLTNDDVKQTLGKIENSQ